MRNHWDNAFRSKPDRYGTEPSHSAQLAAKAFAHLNLPGAELLDLGAGTGRDTIFFAQAGMHVVALDFSAVALEELNNKARSLGLADAIEAVRHDVHDPLPFADSSFDACYAHMLFCMNFTEAELAALTAEVRRILKPGGLLVYTARTTEDPDFGSGIHHGEQLYEDEGFIVHFFDRAMMERLAAGFRIVDFTNFEEGTLPRRLFTVTLQKTI